MKKRRNREAAPSWDHQCSEGPDFSRNMWNPCHVASNIETVGDSPLSLSFTWKALPDNSNVPAPSCVNEPSKLNPCPIVCYVLVLTKEQGKGKWALPKNLRRLLKTIWQRKAVWKTLFQNKPSGTINPVYLPRNSWTTQRMCQSTTRCLFQLLPNTSSCNLWGTSHEQQWHPSSYACSTLAVSLKRWDVEAGTIKRTSQRNKGMAEKHTKSLV